MSLFFRILTYLFPRSRVWSMTVDRLLTKMVQAFADTFQACRDAIDQVWSESLATETTELERWEKEFGLKGVGTDDERRAKIAVAKLALGGQSPKYIQDIIHAAGFDQVYLHEWWIPGSGPPVTIRDPRDYLREGGIGTVQAGEALAEAGEPSAEANDLASGYFDYISTPISPDKAPPGLPTTEDGWTGFLYFGGETFGDAVKYSPELKEEFITLVRRICPGHLWIGLLVYFTDDNTAPAFVSAETNDAGTQVIVTMDEGCDSRFDDESAFALTGCQVAVIDSLAVVGAELVFEVTGPIFGGDLPQIEYTKPGSGRVLTDNVDNETASFGPEDVTNTIYAPDVWGLFFNFDGDEGITLSGGDVEEWEATLGGVTMESPGADPDYSASHSPLNDQPAIFLSGGKTLKVDPADWSALSQRDLHDGSTSYEIGIVCQAQWDCVLFYTLSQGAPGTGVQCYVTTDGKLGYEVIKGGSIEVGKVETAAGSVIQGAAHLFRIRYDKPSDEYSVAVDDGSFVTAAASATQSSSSPDVDFTMGGGSEFALAHVWMGNALPSSVISNDQISYAQNRYDAVAFSPGKVPNLLSWMKGDAGTMARAGSVVYSTFIDTGSTGGNLDPGADAHPIAVTTNARRAPAFRGSRRLVHSQGAAFWPRFNDSGSNFYEAISFRPYQVTTGATLLATFDGSNANTGILVYVNGSGRIQADVGNGSGSSFAASVESTVTLSAGTRYDVVVAKFEGDLQLSVNGETVVIDTLSSPDNGSPQHALVLGNNLAGTAACDGIIHEHVLYEGPPGATPEAELATYMASTWEGTPDYSPLSETEDTVAWIRSDQVALDVGIEFAYDESGYNSDLQQSTDADQPTLEAAWRNGHALIRGDGSSDHLSRTTFTTGAISQPGTIVQVGVWHSVASSTRFSVDGGVSRWATREGTVSNGEVVLFAGANNAQSGISAPTGLPYIRRDVVESSSSKLLIRTDGNADQSSSTWSADPGSGGMNGLSLLADSAGALATDGGLAEVIIFAGDVSSGDAAVEYLSEKYNISAA